MATRPGVHLRGKEGSSSEPESHHVMGWGLFLKRSLASPCRSLRLQSISCTTLDNQVKFFRPQCAHLNNEGRWSTFRLPVSGVDSGKPWSGSPAEWALPRTLP